MTSAYVDTCVVSQFAKQNGKAAEMQAFQQLLDAVDTGVLKLVASERVKTEINQIPNVDHRVPHLEVYAALGKLQLASHHAGNLMLLGVGGPKAEYSAICRIGFLGMDADHLFQGVMSNCQYFVTTDEKTILNRKKECEEVFEQFTLMPLLPSKLVQLLCL